MKLPILKHHKECRQCNLFTEAHFIGIASRPLFTSSHRQPTALLVIGESPGHMEDEQGQPFIGPAGHVLRDHYLEPTEIPQHADIYVGNSCRCRCMGTPTKGQIKACRPWLHEDILTLQKHYRNVVLLGVGAVAAQSLGHSTLAKALKAQGSPYEFEAEVSGTTEKITVPCFFTAHPAALLPERGPSASVNVMDHLDLLERHLTGRLPEAPDFTPLYAPPPPKGYFPSTLALDIETYGFVEGFPEQTCFHPTLFERFDGVPAKDAVRTAALAGYNQDGEAWTAIFLVQNSAHRRQLSRWLSLAKKHQTLMVGHNFSFDLACLRATDHHLRDLLSPPLRVFDTQIASYLDNELRPERSLKDLAALFGVTQYAPRPDGHRFTSDHDPALHKYNAQDAWATLELLELFRERIPRMYGAHTHKLSDACLHWYSSLIWSVLGMTETGAAFSRRRLADLEATMRRACEQASEEYKSATGHPLTGKGSQGPIFDLMQRGLLCAPPDIHSELSFTKKAQCSSEAANIVLLRPHVSPEDQRAMDALTKLRRCQKIQTTYARPILEESLGTDRRGRPAFICYPSWYITPSALGNNQKAKADIDGGVKQGRLSAKSPALQTLPPPVQQCRTTRFCPGFLIQCDLSQIELRIAALLSNDPIMMEEYAGHPDLHGRTARLIFGEDIVNDPDYKKVYRQAGKRANFLMIYGGGAKRLHEALLEDPGIYYPLDNCHEAVDSIRNTYRGLVEYQQRNHAIAESQGYLELPPFGASRLFIDSETYITEINNFPVQYYAAIVMQSAIMELQLEIHRRKMKAVVPCQTHDSVDVECPRIEEPHIREMTLRHLTDPPAYRILCDHLGRSLPLEAEYKVLVERTR